VAEQCLKQLLVDKKLNDKFEVVSRGIQGRAGIPAPKHKNMTGFSVHWATTKPILEKLGIDVTVFEAHESKPITKEIADKSYIIFAMDNEVLRDHEASLVKQFPQHAKKIRIFLSMVGGEDDIRDCGPFADDVGLHQCVNEKIVNTVRRGFLSWMKKEETIVDIKHILKDHAYQNIPLNYKEAYELGLYALKGCAGDEMAQKQSIAALCALHTKATYAWKKTKRAEKIHGHRLSKNAAEQITGICAAIFKHDIAVSENGFLNPQVEYVMDNCGMGGDLFVTPNVSTVAGFIAAAAGIPMCKHGSPANADKGLYGSSDFVALVCGIDEMASVADVERSIQEFNFGYTEALDTKYKHIHLQTHRIAQLPHMNDIIGPITNPVNPKLVTKRVLGINHLIAPRIVAETYKILNEKKVTNLNHGLFVRGFADKYRYEGMDEVSICPGGTQVAELKNGRIREFDLYARDFGLKAVPAEAIAPQGNKGQFSLKILKGEISGPPLQMILANAAVLFYLAGRSHNLKECYKMAEEIHQSGKAYETMLAVQKMLPRKPR